MRRPRLKAPASHPVAYYHCVSRVVNRDFVLGDAERDKLVQDRCGKLRREIPVAGLPAAAGAALYGFAPLRALRFQSQV
jgi:hypothetical protein